MNTNPESTRFHRRSMVCATIVLILFFIVLARLMYLQLIEHRFYATLSKRNVISTIPVKPDRGIIYDRNGVVLAKNIPVYSLMLIPARVKNMQKTLAALSKIISLTPDDIQNFNRIVKQYYPYQTVPLKQQLTESQVDSLYVNQYRFPGVVVQKNMIRNYPLGNALSNVVGYVGRINTHELAQVNPTNYTASDEIGKAGVEKEDEILLHGMMGSEEAEIDANGKVVRVIKTTPPVAGDNIYLTIDSKLQARAEKLFGKNAGALVAIQPATGQILALVTKPNYDPNLFVNGMTAAEYHAVMTAPDHPLFNRATRALYAPGSTIKPFIAFGALNDGVIDTQDYIFDPGWFRIPHTKHIFHNWKKNGFGWVNVTKSIMVSCDTFFYQLAVVLGIDRLDQAVTQFGFGSLTGVNLPGERAGVVPSPDWKQKHIGQEWYAGDTVVAGIGQGYMLVTPIQLAVATATMAERGLKFQPTVLLKLQQPDGMITAMQPIIEKPIVAQHPKAWETVIQGMQDVVMKSEGTAFPSFQNITYTVAGKTGTAQVYASDPNAQTDNTQKTNEPTRLQNNHLFICFAPIDNPQIAIAVVVEHIHGMSQRGVQIARQLLDYYFKELQQAQAASPSNAQPTTPTAILPTPQGTVSNTPENNTNKQNLPAPSGPSLLPDASMQSIKRKKPAENPVPPTAENPATNTNTNPTQQPAPQPTIKSAYLDQLQQQMEMKVKTQMEMQAALQQPSTSHANTNRQ